MFCYVMDVPGPVEAYERLHAAISTRVGGRDVGMLVHLGRATAAGCQVIEVWRSRKDFDRFVTDIAMPIMRELSGPDQFAGPLPIVEVEPLGLIIPAAGIEI